MHHIIPEEFSKQIVRWNLFSINSNKSYSENKKIYNIFYKKFLRKILISFPLFEKSNINLFFEYVSINHWNIIKLENLSKILNCSNLDLDNFISYLIDNNIILVLNNFYIKNGLKKIYFLDNWLRNFIIKNFVWLENRNDDWVLFESFVIWKILLLWVDKNKLYYWQNIKKNEIDLIININSKILSFEIKLKKKIKENDLDNLINFKKNYAWNSFLINTENTFYDDKLQIHYINVFSDIKYIKKFL